MQLPSPKAHSSGFLPPPVVERWRIDFCEYLRICRTEALHGAGEAALRARLEGMIRALDHRLEQRRTGRRG
jgi:hypothetical protein